MPATSVGSVKGRTQRSDAETGEAPGGRASPAWLPHIEQLLSQWAVPLSPAEEADPYRLKRLTEEVRERSLRMLSALLKLEPEMPEPEISPTGSGGLDIEWCSDDMKLMLGFEVEPDVEAVSAWGIFGEGQEPWDGTTDNSKENIKRALSLLTSS